MATDGRVVRAPNHLGDLVLALPALAALQGATIVVAAGLAPLIADTFDDILPFTRGRAGFLATARALRSRGVRRGILLPPSFSSALLFRAGGVGHLRGLDTDARRLLLADPVARADFDALHRAAGYLLLATGSAPAEPPRPRLAVSGDGIATARTLIGAAGRRVVGVFPGSNASSRRWDAERFREVARQCAAGGDRVVVFGGPDERSLTAFVAGADALDLGGRTDLPLLAAGLASCDILVTNDSGPMHLAGAVGTPVVAMMGAGDPAATGPLGPVRALLVADLPCVPCVKNVCPRSGTGFLLPEAERECLRLIEVPAVLRAMAPTP